MTDTRIRIFLTIALLGLALAALLTIQPYSAPSRWSVYDVPGQRFLSAALSGDSAEVNRLAVSSAAADWAVRTRRDHPHALSVWARFAKAEAGVVRSDTSSVLFDTATEVCPLLISFVRQESRARVLEVKARCYSNTRDAF